MRCLNKNFLEHTKYNTDIDELIKKQLQLRFENATNVGLKINLYTSDEVAALADAIQSQDLKHKCTIESIMVGDSYFTTHLGRDSTKLPTIAEQKFGFDTMISLVADVRAAINRYFTRENKPYLIGDMPDGSISTIETALQTAQQMVDAGADVIKIEIVSRHTLKILKALSNHHFYVMAHIGYTPQNGKIKRHGDSFDDALAIFALARKARDHGACSLVLEMMNEVVNQVLCKHNDNMLQVYSIFSGKAEHGGQSLNVWDSVFLPPSARKFFPPTAEYMRSEYPIKYTHDVIKNKISELIKLTMLGDFPKSPLSNLSDDEKKCLLALDPWKDCELPCTNIVKIDE